MSIKSVKSTKSAKASTTTAAPEAKASNRAPFVKAAVPPQKKTALPISPTQWVTDAAESKYTLLSQSADLDNEISSLRLEIESLQRVLEPVMVSESKGGDVFDFPTPRLGSVLGTQIDQMRVAVRHLSLHVRSLADRVELV